MFLVDLSKNTQILLFSSSPSPISPLFQIARNYRLLFVNCTLWSAIFIKYFTFRSANGITFEVGGKNKTGKQVKEAEVAYLVKDNIEYALGNTIPIWMFGFVYWKKCLPLQVQIIPNLERANNFLYHYPQREGQ